MNENPETKAGLAELQRVTTVITNRIESLVNIVYDETALSSTAISITKGSPATSALKKILMVPHAKNTARVHDTIKNAQLTVSQRAMIGRDAKKLKAYTTALQETELTTGPN